MSVLRIGVLDNITAVILLECLLILPLAAAAPDDRERRDYAGPASEQNDALVPLAASDPVVRRVEDKIDQMDLRIFLWGQNEQIAIQEAIRILNPELNDPVWHVHQQFETLKQSELGLLLRDIGIAETADAVVNSGRSSNFVNMFFDHYAQLRYGISMPNFMQAVQENRVIDTGTWRGYGVLYHCLCHVDLSDWLYPAGSQELFKPIPNRLKTESGILQMFYGSQEYTLSSIVPMALQEIEWHQQNYEQTTMAAVNELPRYRAVPSVDENLGPLNVFMEELAKQTVAENIPGSISWNTAIEFAKLPVVLTDAGRERLTYQSLVQIVQDWRDIRAAMQKVIDRLPTELHETAEEAVKARARTQASADIPDRERDSERWRQRFIYHLEHETFRALARLVREDDTLRQEWGYYWRLLRVASVQHQNSLRWVRGGQPMLEADVVYAELFRTAYRYTQSEIPVYFQQVKQAADKAMGRPSREITLMDGAKELVWAPENSWMDPLKIRQLRKIFTELRELRSFAPLTGEQGQTYMRLLDKLHAFERHGRQRDLWLTPFWRQRLLLQMQKTIYRTLRSWRADDPNPDNWGKCPTTFIP